MSPQKPAKQTTLSPNEFRASRFVNPQPGTSSAWHSGLSGRTATGTLCAGGGGGGGR